MPLQLLDSANRKTLLQMKTDSAHRSPLRSGVSQSELTRESQRNHLLNMCFSSQSHPCHAAFEPPRQSTASPEPRSSLRDTSALEIINYALRFRQAALFGSVADIP